MGRQEGSAKMKRKYPCLWSLPHFSYYHLMLKSWKGLNTWKDSILNDRPCISLTPSQFTLGSVQGTEKLHNKVYPRDQHLLRKHPGTCNHYLLTCPKTPSRVPPVFFFCFYIAFLFPKYLFCPFLWKMPAIFFDQNLIILFNSV